MPQRAPRPEVRLVEGENPLAELLTVWFVGKMDFAVGVAHVAHVLRKAPIFAVGELAEQHFPAVDLRTWAQGVYPVDARALNMLGGGMSRGLSTAITLAMPKLQRRKGPALRRFIAKETARVHDNDRREREDARGVATPAQSRLFELPGASAELTGAAAPDARAGRQALLREWQLPREN